jgi:hypothetical protein
VLEVLLVCTQLAKSALLDDVNDDSVCDKVEKKSSRPWLIVGRSEIGRKASRIV